MGEWMIMIYLSTKEQRLVVLPVTKERHMAFIDPVMTLFLVSVEGESALSATSGSHTIGT
jgi:hypothetical protein